LLLLLLVAAAVVTAPGCGSDQLDLVRVKGKVTVDGKPVGPLTIYLAPQTSEALPVNGYVDANGQFELTTYKAGDGAPEGTYAVSLMEDPTKPGEVPQVKPATVEIAKPSGGGTLDLEVNLESGGAANAKPRR
jgi:hypothetical protein